MCFLRHGGEGSYRICPLYSVRHPDRSWYWFWIRLWRDPPILPQEQVLRYQYCDDDRGGSLSPRMSATLFGTDSWTESLQIYCVGASQVSLFGLDDWIIQSPSKLRERCNKSCLSISSFQRAVRKEVVSSLSGLRFKVEKLARPVVFNGRLREKISFVIVTVWDNCGAGHHV